SALFFSAFWGLVIFCINKALHRKAGFTVINALSAACLFCVFESLLMFVSAGFPWFDFHAGYALVSSLYFIQPASFFGVYIITFMVVLVNYLVAAFLYEKRWPGLIL